MEEILVVALQLIFEVLLDVLSYLPFDVFETSNRTAADRPPPKSSGARWLLWLLLGGAMAGVSLLIVPHTLIHKPSTRIALLLTTAPLSGVLAGLIASWRSARNPRIVPMQRFWTAFAFGIGFSLIRFAYAQRI